MNLIDYQRLALRTEKPLPTQAERLEHAALGLVTEIGEYTTEVKRMAIYGKPLDDKRRAHMAEELGDVMWYMAIAADALELQLADVNPMQAACQLSSHAMTVLGLAGHVGQIADAATRLIFPDKTPPLAVIASRLPWAMKLIMGLAEILGVSLETICANNIAKLQERFPEAYSNEAAEARADKGGLDARVS